MLDDSLVTDSSSLLGSSLNPYTTNLGGSLEPPNLIIPNEAINTPLALGASPEIIDLKARASRIGNNSITLNSFGQPQNTFSWSDHFIRVPRDSVPSSPGSGTPGGGDDSPTVPEDGTAPIIDTRIDGSVTNQGETGRVEIRIPDGLSTARIENLETWVVIHGNTDSPEPKGNIGRLANTIAQEGRQVLVLDWSDIADNYGQLRPDLTARWIHDVADFAVGALSDIWKIATSNINLIGHSLGAYVASEMGSLFTGTQRQNPQVNRIIALDPARSSSLGGYDLDGDRDGFQSISDYKDVSTFSRAFWGDLPDDGLGSARYAHSANESFRIEFRSDSAQPDQNHSNIVGLFSNMLSQTGAISNFFHLDEGRHNDWRLSDDNDEGILVADGSNKPTLLAFKDPNTQNDDIVYGSIWNDTLDGGYTDSNFFGIYNGWGNDTFYGDSGDDVIYGDQGNDQLYGDEGNDTIYGENDNDTIRGGRGRDTLRGGWGNDRFVFAAGDGGANEDQADVIEDFSPGGWFSDSETIGLTSGLTRNNITWEQGTGSYQNDTVIKRKDANEVLAILKGVSASSLRDGNFYTV